MTGRIVAPLAPVPRALVIALFAVAATGCLYLEPINERPEAAITKRGQGPHYEGQVVTLDALASYDPDGNMAIDVAWQVCPTSPADCPPEAGFETRPRVVPYEVELRDQGAITVNLRVFDESGAFDTDQIVIEVQNRPPEITVETEGIETGGDTYQVATAIDIHAEVRDLDCFNEIDPDDPDCAPPALTWKLYPPTGSAADARGFEPLDATTYELWPDVAGLWEVEITARDVRGGETTVTEAIVVGQDAPPCIAQTSPQATPEAVYVVDATSGPRPFAVLAVTDSLDPYPPDPGAPEQGVAAFSWQVASPVTGGVLVPLEGHTQNELTVDPTAYLPGDRLTLRVEVRDRANQAIGCPADEPTCSLSNDACLQRVTWEVVIR